jgi:hypothetical protein
MGLPGWLWGEDIATTVYLLNRSPTKSLQSQTPFESWYGKKPGVLHLHTFACVVHVKNTRPNLKKLEDRSTPMIFIGYEPGSKAYHVYDPVLKKVHVSRDMIFDESAQWDWSMQGEQGDSTKIDDTFSVEMEYTTVAQDGLVEIDGDRTPVGAASLGSPMGSPTLTPVAEENIGQ